MKLLFDQNISHRILKLIPELYAGSSTVKQEKLIDSPDRVIWEFAKSHQFTLVTQDSDFNDLNSVFGFPPKIIWIRTGNLKTQALANIFIDYHKEIQTFIDNQEFGCFELFRLK